LLGTLWRILGGHYRVGRGQVWAGRIGGTGCIEDYISVHAFSFGYEQTLIIPLCEKE